MGNPAAQHLGSLRPLSLWDPEFMCIFSLEKGERPSVPARPLSLQPRGSSQGCSGGPGLGQGWDSRVQWGRQKPSIYNKLASKQMYYIL